MIESSSASPCVKCGRPVPPGAGFCPNCGTQITAPTFMATGLTNPADPVVATHLPVSTGTQQAQTQTCAKTTKLRIRSSDSRLLFPGDPTSSPPVIRAV